ncbi:Gef1p [Sugiyamaella lignohabitans]|uniref:Chloride channel protein n=1 Tax=Sugiyamaella lignohabitans TaxID=796027 RepID=A0A167DMV6_9ASCO|nr:Gef1p [Sugiyamaella lignohabitans]ANB13084.1 Gef1p [Sugiyamaella lignohabitans]
MSIPLGQPQALSNWKSGLKLIYNTSKLWLVLIWTGVLVGVLAAGIDIVSQWLGSLKFGRCETAFYLSESFCCWGGNTFASDTCDLWIPWAPRSYALRYLVYACLTVLFAVIASVLVSEYAVTARLSGIPELKMIIDGASKPGFLSARTLLIKTLGLCLIVGSGLWAGKEGPLVHVASCCAYLTMTALFPPGSEADEEKYHDSSFRQVSTGISTGTGADNGETINRRSESSADLEFDMNIDSEGEMSTRPGSNPRTSDDSVLTPPSSSSRGSGVKRLREILPAASAAGISVAFGAPIGGVLFSLEAISCYYSNDSRILWHSFVCAMVAAVSLQYMNPFRTGKLVLFQVVYDRIWHRFELLPFAFIGVLGGLYGAAVIKLNMRFAIWRNEWPLLSTIPPAVEVASVALITGIISYPVFYMRLQPSLLLSYLFQECSPSMPGHLCDVNYWFSTFLLLVFSAVVGLVLTAYTFGINIPAGTLMPSMVVGALGGRSVGLLMQAWQAKNPDLFLFSTCPPNDGSGGVCITPGVYAVVGAAAALTGVTRLTVSSVVILFELTGALTYVLPIMSGVMVSKWVAEAFERKGIYEAWITNHWNYPLLDNSRNIPIPDVPASNYMVGMDELPVIVVNQRPNVQAMYELLSSTPTLNGYTALTTLPSFPIIDNLQQRNILGLIAREDLEEAIKGYGSTDLTQCYFVDVVPEHPGGLLPSGLDLRPLVDRFPSRLSYRAQVLLAVKMFQELGLNCLLLTNRGKLFGAITKRQIWRLLSISEYEILSQPRRRSSTRQSIPQSSESSPYHSGEDRGLLEGNSFTL